MSVMRVPTASAQRMKLLADGGNSELLIAPTFADGERLTARRLYVADGHILCGFDYLHALHTVHMQCGSNGGQRHVLTDKPLLSQPLPERRFSRGQNRFGFTQLTS